MKFRSGIKQHEVIVKGSADFFLPFSIVFGVYIILFGTISPGGGFQGGVITAAGAILLYLGYGYSNAKKALSPEVLRVNEACGATLYVFLGFLGIILGANFARNVFFDNGNVGDMISAGTITFMGYSVGYKVLTGVSFLVLLMLSALAPGSDDDDYGFEEEAENDYH